MRWQGNPHVRSNPQNLLFSRRGNGLWVFPVKVISALWFMAAAALASPSDPGNTAIQFLEKVRTKTLNLEPGGDTALSPQTSDHKRREISRRLDRIANDLGTDALEVGPVKFDSDFAAVLVRKTGGFDPNSLQVFPIALVKRGSAWAAAPVPASFENSGTGYAADIRKRLGTLEDWMLREQALDLEKLREQSMDRMRRNIETSLPPATLRKLDSIQVAERFLKACENRNLSELLGLVGGLDVNPPADWPLRLKAADTAIAAGSGVRPPWRLLIAPEVMRAIVHHEDDGQTALVSIACLDPSGGHQHTAVPKIELIHLELTKGREGLWRIDPPAAFLLDSPGQEDAGDDDLDADLLDAFPAKLTEKIPPSPQPTAEQASQTLLAALQNGNPSLLFGLMRFPDEPKTARKSCVRAAQTWWALHDPSAIRRAVPLSFHEDGNLAAGAYQFFSARSPERLDLQILYFEKSPDGWHWNPQPTAETEQTLSAWTELQTKRGPDEWRRTLLADSFKLDKFPDDAVVPEEEARKLFDSWFQTLRSADIQASLRLTARLNDPKSDAILLRNLGYEITDARRNPAPPTITAVHCAKILTAVATKTGSTDNPAYPLYPVVQTPFGPRILLEIDLFASGSRSRDFLNKTALNHLRNSSPSAADELAGLFSKHQTQTAAPPPP